MKMMCMPVGWGRHYKFEGMVAELGHAGVGVYLMLQDFVLEHGDEEWGFQFKPAGASSLEAVAKRLVVTKDLLSNVIDFAATEEMVDFKDGRLVFSKAKNLCEECLEILAQSSGSSSGSSRGSSSGSSQGVPTHVREERSSYVSAAPQPARSEAASDDRLLSREFTREERELDEEENLKGFCVSRNKILEGLGFYPGQPYKVMETEAREFGVPVQFDKAHRKRIANLIEQNNEEAVHGAFRCFLFEDRGKPLSSYPIKDRAVMFLSDRVFPEKLGLFKNVEAGMPGPRYVKVAHDQDMLPEGPPRLFREVPMGPPVVIKTADVLDRRPKEKSWAQQKIDERAGLVGDPLEIMGLIESTQGPSGKVH